MQVNKNTKFNIGDQVFYMNNNKPQTGEVATIVVQIVKDDKDSVNYGLLPADRKEGEMVMATYVPEPLVFKTKEELINSL